MPNQSYYQTPAKDNYDPRWFIWTIVFLVITGISLVSYILLSDNSADEAQALFNPSQVLKR